ncbi:hypothetical protein H733_0396 [Haemophilus influenzae CGSHiCZ412602]|nr:hypothetical protein H733_0396 [Haemophilus influenzae CGSHiCZ412602]
MRLKISENFDRTSAISNLMLLFLLPSPALRGKMPEGRKGA